MSIQKLRDVESVNNKIMIPTHKMIITRLTNTKTYYFVGKPTASQKHEAVRSFNELFKKNKRDETIIEITECKLKPKT